jgi:hypothetical protein
MKKKNIKNTFGRVRLFFKETFEGISLKPSGESGRYLHALFWFETWYKTICMDLEAKDNILLLQV